MMGDLHHLPLLGHDVPDPATFPRARVFKGPYGWQWEHDCPSYPVSVTSITYPGGWQEAVLFARWHVQGCR